MKHRSFGFIEGKNFIPRYDKKNWNEPNKKSKEKNLANWIIIEPFYAYVHDGETNDTSHHVQYAYLIFCKQFNILSHS